MIPVRIAFQDLSASLAELRPGINRAIDRVLSSGWLLLGKELESFEDAWAKYCQAGYAIGVSNGLDALHLILRAWGVGAGDEVIVPANTYIASWLAVSHTGARPVPVEPQWDTCTIDVSLIEGAITSRTKAIMVVHLYGHPCDMDPVVELARKYGIKVVEDAAQAHGALYKGRRIGGHGDAVAWSFYPTKNLGALGDAGAITTNDRSLVEQIRLLRNYGSRVRYENEVMGYNNRMEELHAAVLSEKLEHLTEWNRRRSDLAIYYYDALKSTDLVLPEARSWAGHAWHLYTIRHPKRNLLRDRLDQLGIGTLIHYPIPPHLQKAYVHLGYKKGHFPIAERIHDEILSIPFGPHLGAVERERVAAAVHEALSSLGCSIS